MSEEINESVPTEAVEQSPATVAEDGTIKLDMRQVQEPQEEVVEEAVSEEPVAEVQEVVAEEPIEEFKSLKKKVLICQRIFKKLLTL